MEIEEYMKQRVENQIDWYNKSSINNKNYYVLTKMTLTISAAVIPALTAFMDDNVAIKVCIGILSVITVILTNITGIFRFKDNWVQYRNMCELLQSEKYLYIRESGKYKNNKEKDMLFVESIESHLQSENSQWIKTINSAQQIEK